MSGRLALALLGFRISKKEARLPNDRLIIAAFMSAGLVVALRPSLEGVLALLIALSFTAFLVWLHSKPKAFTPEILSLRAEITAVKDKVDKLILGGRPRG